MRFKSSVHRAFCLALLVTADLVYIILDHLKSICRTCNAPTNPQLSFSFIYFCIRPSIDVRQAYVIFYCVIIRRLKENWILGTLSRCSSDIDKRGKENKETSNKIKKGRTIITKHENLEKKVAKGIKLSKKNDKRGTIFHLCYLPLVFCTKDQLLGFIFNNHNSFVNSLLHLVLCGDGVYIYM